VISLGSFSKILAPGLRLGWIQAAPAVIQRLVNCGLLTSGGGMNPFTSAVVRGLIEDGSLQHNIQHLVEAYASRVEAMDAALKRYLPEAEFTTPQGGYFFWLRLPGCDTPAMRPRAQSLQTDFRPGTLFSSRAGLREHMRLSISFYDGNDIDRGLQRLGQALHSA
jgi:DNA-binding transcriptional MocR family regulator